MGSANGCCKNPQVDNNNSKNANKSGQGRSKPAPSQAVSKGEAWEKRSEGQLNPSFRPEDVNTNQVVVEDKSNIRTSNGEVAEALVKEEKVLSEQSVQSDIVNSEETLTDSDENCDKNANDTSNNSIGSVVLMLMRSFSQQPRDLLIYLGVGNQQVRPVSVVKEDREVLKTASKRIFKIAVTDDEYENGCRSMPINFPGLNTSYINVPTAVISPARTTATIL